MHGPGVGVAVNVLVGVEVLVDVSVDVAVDVAVAVDVGQPVVGQGVAVGVSVGVSVAVGVEVAVGQPVGKQGVAVAVFVGVRVGVAVAVGVGLRTATLAFWMFDTGIWTGSSWTRTGTSIRITSVSCKGDRPETPLRASSVTTASRPLPLWPGGLEPSVLQLNRTEPGPKNGGRQLTRRLLP
ncbi:MAG: hypothetical protein Q8S13_02910, partial [Dehalococcoidia bacterium]|nr:hypothetical protein [Dehalococcoidia bacterium]